MQVLLEQIPKLHLFSQHESTLLVFAAADGSIIGDLYPESASYDSSQDNKSKFNEDFTGKWFLEYTHGCGHTLL